MTDINLPTYGPQPHRLFHLICKVNQKDPKTSPSLLPPEHRLVLLAVFIAEASGSDEAEKCGINVNATICHKKKISSK